MQICFHINGKKRKRLQQFQCGYWVARNFGTKWIEKLGPRKDLSFRHSGIRSPVPISIFIGVIHPFQLESRKVEVIKMRNSLILPVLRTIEHCKINCGAASRKASRMPALRASCFILRTKVEFSGKLVSVNRRAKNELKFL